MLNHKYERDEKSVSLINTGYKGKQAYQKSRKVFCMSYFLRFSTCPVSLMQ